MGWMLYVSAHSITVIDLTFKLRKTKVKQTEKEEEKMSTGNIYSSHPLLLVISVMVLWILFSFWWDFVGRDGHT